MTKKGSVRRVYEGYLGQHMYEKKNYKKKEKRKGEGGKGSTYVRLVRKFHVFGSGSLSRRDRPSR